MAAKKKVSPKKKAPVKKQTAKKVDPKPDAFEFPYQVLTYAGDPLHRCGVCQWDTLDRTAINQFQTTCQRLDCPVSPRPAYRGGQVLIADASGREVK